MGPQHKRTQYEVVILKLKGFSFYPSRPVVLGIPVLPSLWDCPPIQQSTNGGYSKLSYRPWVWTRAQKRSAGMFFVQVGRQSAQLLPIRAVYSDSELGTWLPCWASPSFNRFVVSANPPAGWGMHIYLHITNKHTHIYIYFLENSTSSNFLRGCVVTTQMPTENLSHPMKPAMFDPKVVLPTSRSESLSQSCSHCAGGSVGEFQKWGEPRCELFGASKNRLMSHDLKIT